MRPDRAAGVAGGGRGPRGAVGRGPLSRSRSFDPDPRAALDMGMIVGPAGMPYHCQYGPPYGQGGGPPGYGPAFPYQHHQQLVHRPNPHSPVAGDGSPSRCALFWRYVWKLSSCLCSHVTLVSLVIAYCLLGATTFEKLEKDNEVMIKKNISYRRSNMTQWLWTLTADTDVLRQENWTASAIGRLKQFEQELLWAMRTQGWDGIEDETKLQWTFAGALFYSIIVITTIGK